MKKYFKAQSAMYPEPVLMIGTYNEDGSANMMNAAWGGISDTNEIHICLGSHRTTDNILRLKEFTVSMGTAETMEACDYVGMVSGNKVNDKVSKAGFTPSKAEHVNAPVFEELPFGLECELISFDENTGHLYAKILHVYMDESILKDGKPDLSKFHPIIFDGMNNKYVALGETVGDAFKAGRKLFD